MTYLHLDVGTTLVPRESGSILLAAPDERFAVLATDDPEALIAALRGLAPIPARGTVREIADALVDWGAARLAPSARASAPAPPLAPMSAPARKVIRSRYDVVVATRDVLDDAAWTERDGAPTPWVPLHRELGALIVGPVLGRPTDRFGALRWSDVRFRRLTASPAREQLTALWGHWGRVGDADDARPSRAALLGAVDRLSTWLVHDGDGRLERHQIVVPLDGSAITAHPVLPVPAGLMGSSGAPPAVAS